MINNEHNPIAIRVGYIQNLWMEKRQECPDAKVYCLTCNQEDYPLVEGSVWKDLLTEKAVTLFLHS